MGYPRPDAERLYLEKQLGNRWRRLLSNGQIFNWFVDFAAQESKIDREKIVQRLRVFSSREETPTAFWLMLVSKFYEEGGHLGLRKFVDEGVTYHCPPQYFADFRELCESAPSYKSTVSWEFRPDYLSGRIFAHVFCPGIKNWFKRSWPDALSLQNQRYLVSYYPAGAVNRLADAVEEEDDEACLECYRSIHSLLCLMFGGKSPAAFDLSLGSFASKRILEVVADPYLGTSSHSFSDAALDLAALCVDSGSSSNGSPLSTKVLALLENLAKHYSGLESSMLGDADYMYLMTYRLMPLSKKSSYAALMADFESAMKGIVIECADEVARLGESRKGEDDEESELNLHLEREEFVRCEPYTVEIVKQYLQNAPTRECMDLEAFDALLHWSDKIDGKSSDIVPIPRLKKIVRERVRELTSLIEATGEFLVSGSLMVALMEVGQVSVQNCPIDYGDLVYRTDSDRPWLETAVKFEGGAAHLDDARDEFLAYCRIISGK